MGNHREPTDEASLAQIIGRTQEALGSAAFAAVESAGRALSYDQVIAEARAWLEQQSTQHEEGKQPARRSRQQA